MDHHLSGIAIPGDPAVSPDGRRVAFGVSTIDVEADKYVKQVWMAEGDTAAPFTAGDGDSSPRFSPDGRHIAFLRVVDKRPQVAVIPAEGGEGRVLTDFGVGAMSEPVWSPDSSTIAVAGGEWAGGFEGLDDDERQRRPRHIADRAYRADNIGWTHDRRQHIYLVGIEETHSVRRLTDRDEEESSPAWSPDGFSVAFLSDTAGPRGYRLGREVLEVRVETGDDGVVGPLGQWSKLSYRPDGVLHALGSAGEGFPEPAMLWRLDADPRQVNAGHDRSLFSFAAGPPRLAWDGDTAVVTLVDSGAIGLARITSEGTVEQSYLDQSVVTGFDLAAGTRAMTVSTIDSPGKLVVERDGDSFKYEDFGGPVPAVITPDHFVVDGVGGVPLDVWVYLPKGEETVPLLLNIHGGPASQYGWGFFDEFQVYADAGYGVVATNPRGSAGRDREFLQAVSGRGWGEVDVEDIDVVVAAALDRHPRLDQDRLGVMGGSYGGFLTAWLISHQSRWKSAIVERALLSFRSFAGTSDIGGWFGDGYIGDQDLEWERSPIRVAHRIQTPTLIVHSENDFRCPIEQAEQLFDVLLRHGVQTEFVRFPGEGHELSRSGKPRHRVERFEIILDWLRRTL